MAPRPDLSGQTALVTGATGGLGQAIARALHDCGAHVKLTGRRAEILDELVRELGDRAESLPADLADAADAEALSDRAGAVDVLVANAGLPGSGELLDFTREEVDRVVDVNLRAPIQLTHALLRGMLDRGRGHLVYVSSIAGKSLTVGDSLYAATKFGIRGFALTLHEDLRGTGVGVTTVFPGFIAEGGMFAEAEVKLPPGSGKLRTPEDVAEAVLKGIATGRPEIDVAPVVQRAGGWLTGIAPRAVAASVRAAGGDKIAAAMAEGQRDKR